MEASRNPDFVEEIDLEAELSLFEETIVSPSEELSGLTNSILSDGVVDRETVMITLQELGHEDETGMVLKLLESKGVEILDFEQDTKNGKTSVNGNSLPMSTDSVYVFMEKAGRHRILTAAEEVELSKRIEAGADASGQLAGIDPALINGDKEAASKLRNLRALELDGQAAKREMMECNIKLVVSIAKRYRNNGLPYLDVIQEGMLGLSRATEKFDWRKGYKFSTYATWWIRQNITRGIADKASIIRKPAHISELHSKIRTVEANLTAVLMRDPTIEEIASELDISANRVREILDAMEDSISLNSPINSSEGQVAELGDMLVGASDEDEFEEIAVRERNEKLMNFLKAELTEREQRVLIMRFGLGDEQEPSTLEEVGREFGITRERARQIELIALGKLEALLKGEPVPRVFEKPVARLRHFQCGDKIIQIAPSQIELLEAMSNGFLKPDTVAKKLGISFFSAKGKLVTIRSKLGTRTNQEAVEVWHKRIEVDAKGNPIISE